ncbi:hypothetical protein [Streptomyces bauhiniae]|uniref:Uncharacterized protein n=1 Tax=Streptomyces bauhiniae TaxID=2340725 RepID=A0A7K3QX76_9ACTN|nr:hypothetical protein [Streptomyces bauhiniae]
MEQRIGSNSQPLKGEPVTGAGFDPAFIPGLTGPAAQGEAEDAEPAAETADPAEAERSPAPADSVPEAEEVESEEESAEEGGPVFEAADRRARIVADRRGVRLALDAEECEFTWPEIAAVETETARFGKRFTVTVHTPDRRWYPVEIEAASRSQFAEWDASMDAVLDAYFESE